MESVADDKENLKDFLEEADLQQYYELFRDILKVTKVSQLKFVVTEDLAQIGLSKPEQRRYKKIYTKYFPNPYISKIKKLLSSNKKNELYSHGHSSLPIEFQPFAENVKVPTKHIIPVEDITINKELGMGQFGVVQQGTWTTGNQRLQVAIKCLGQERMTSNSTEFLKEAAVMHSIEHRNIVRLYGVVLHLDSLMLVTELAPLRSLLECLREVSLRTSFPVPNLCEFAAQICDGMTYLENKRLIHRDLAARNILVFSKDKVKISDFGLSRALGVGKDYYQTNYNVNLKLPVAWCAPECILYLRFTSASDVWAFGVCLWEMFTYGFQPWAAFSGQQILEAIDDPNFQRLEQPECCPKAYYSTMLECWSHDPHDRPKFTDLGLRLRGIQPEQVQATVNYQRSEGRRTNLLDYKSGQVITVLGKGDVTKCAMWYGVLPGGACGMFDPGNTKPYVKPEKVLSVPDSLSPHPTRNSARLRRPSLLRSDVKRHTYTGKRTIQRSMISSPQGDMKHTGHVGLDGAYFGDISFLDPAGCPPRQVVTPYKPSEDLEQVPLINPNSPSHLSGTSCSPYPLLSSTQAEKEDCDEVHLSYTDKMKYLKKHSHKSISEPTTSNSILNMVKSATVGRSNKSDDNSASTSQIDEIHVYHEISDTDTNTRSLIQPALPMVQSVRRARAQGFKGRSQRPCARVRAPTRGRQGIDCTRALHGLEPALITNRIETTATDNIRSEHSTLPESTGIPKSHGDFSQSLLDEMECMFRSLDGGGRREEAAAASKHSGNDSALRSHTLNKLEKKKGFYSGTMKPMSAHDEKTLDTAVAMANEITTKSMNDLQGNENKLPNSPSERSKFHFKFPLVSLHHHTLHEPDKETAGKNERRNFSEEAKSVPDIQSSFTEESKLAYTSLIEQPTPSSSLISQIAKDVTGIKPATIPKPALRAIERIQFHSLQKQIPYNIRPTTTNNAVNTENHDNSKNEPPIPPRNTKPKLIDKPRHIRKYPLILPNPEIKHTYNKATTEITVKKPIIYQNAFSCVLEKRKETEKIKENNQDVCDGPSTKPDTNPFVTAGPSTSNPFNGTDQVDAAEKTDTKKEMKQNFKEGSLVKDCTDHVSVEDLLEFADQKPCGRQRGIESDEVRIMSKVFKQQVTPEECLEALELCDWNIHQAIKVVRVQVAANCEASLEDCKEIINAKGDIVKASAVILLYKNQVN